MMEPAGSAESRCT